MLIPGQTSTSSRNMNHHHHQGPASAKRGAFVVLEGIDRSGKTSQCKLLLQKLLQVGYAASAARFPNRTTATGRILNEYLSNSAVTLDDRAVHLLFSANRWEAAQDLAQTLRQGETVVCDRYAYSGVAFSSAKLATTTTTTAAVDTTRHNNSVEKENCSNTKHGDADQASGKGTKKPTDQEEEPRSLMSLDWCQAPDRGLPAPDCVIFLHLTPDQAEQRGGYGEERYETRDMQRRVRQRFAELQQLDEQRASTTTLANVPTWHIVNAAQSMEQVQSDIWNIVETTVAEAESKPLYKLWEEGCFEEAPAAANKGTENA